MGRIYAMKKYSLKIGKINLHLSVFFFLFLALISGRIQPFIFLFFFALIHELFHFFTALFFRVKIEYFNILPIGFSLKTEPLINFEWYKELIIVIMGPLSYFFSLQIIYLLYENKIISLIGLENAKEVNLFILLFNLLPIIPLDGGKIIKIILGFFITEKKCMKISGIISIFFLLFYIIYMPIQFTIYIFLIYSQTEYWMYLKFNYQLFLISRLKDFKLRIKFHKKNDLYRNYHNIVFKNGEIYSESDYIFNYIS